MFREPPAGETRFAVLEHSYHRELWRCEHCGHFVNVSPLELDELYGGEYVDATYGRSGIREAYDRIMSIPASLSDNRQRCARIVAVIASHLSRLGETGPRLPRLLDVGAGLGVFPAVMKEHGWSCTIVDPDPRATEHASSVVGARAVTADFMTAELSGTYELVTLNKVLEHVPDPIAMVKKAARHVAPDGVIYIEVPDGEGAITEGAAREEFFIEHRCAFSLASIVLLSRQAGLLPFVAERVREPSSKYTLRVFATVSPVAA